MKNSTPPRPSASSAVKNSGWRRVCIASLIVGVVSLLAYAILTSTNYQYTETVTSGGGGDTAASANYQYAATVGQPVASDSVSSTNYSFRPGFWHEVSPKHSGSVWYVNESTGHDTLGVGTSASPFKTITRALQSAQSYETVSIAPGTYTETVVITTSYIALVGTDTNSSVIDPPGVNSTAGLYGILAQNVTGIVIKDLGVTGAYTAVRFDNVDRSSITGDSFCDNGRHGIELVNGSDTNIINGNTLSYNIVGSGFGVELNGSLFNTVSGNICSSNGQYGVYLQSSANYNIISGNTVNSNQYGIVIAGPSARVTNNVVSSNSLAGLWVLSGSNLYAAQNTLTNNTEYQISYNALGPGSSLVELNNISPSVTNPDSGVFNASDTDHNLRRNWWGTSDETKIDAKIFDTASTKKIAFRPYRQSAIDTAANADTRAPIEPQNFGVSSAIAGVLTLTWSTPTLDEDSATLTGIGPIRVYRMVTTADTTYWANALYATRASGVTSFTDTDVSAGTTYYYRLTADDTATIVNRSWFTDTKWGTPVSNASADSIIIVSGNHSIGTSGGAATLVMDLKDSAGSLIPYDTVSFTVSYEGGSATSLSDGVADSAGRLSYSASLSSGDGVYEFTASCKSGAEDDAKFIVYTDARSIGAGKWEMISPFKRPDTSLTGLSQFSYDGTVISYWYDPTGADDATFDLYKSVYGQADPNDAPATFSVYEPGRGYWVKGTQATSMEIAGHGGYTLTDTFELRLAAGANMIGNPFPFYICWLSDVAIETDNIGGTQAIQLAYLSSNTVIDTRLQWRDRNANQYVNPYGASETSVQLKPWAGFWVDVNQACTMVFYPNPRMPMSAASRAQAPEYLTDKGTGRQGDNAPTYKQHSAGLNSWRVRLMGYTDKTEIRDEYAFIGVAPGADDGEDINDMWKAPGMMGDMQVVVGQADAGTRRQGDKATQRSADGEKYYGASIASPIQTAKAWPVAVSVPAGTRSATLQWDVSGLPDGLEAYIIGSPAGPVNLRQSSSLVLATSPSLHVSLSLIVGAPEFLAAFLASPLSKEQTFAYPNPGPDAATGSVTFGYNLPAAADVQIKIFDVGGRLVRELGGTGTAGANTIVWDTTNRHGQKVGSGVYIYKIESDGEKLVDKLAIVR